MQLVSWGSPVFRNWLPECVCVQERVCQSWVYRSMPIDVPGGWRSFIKTPSICGGLSVSWPVHTKGIFDGQLSKEKLALDHLRLTGLERQQMQRKHAACTEWRCLASAEHDFTRYDERNRNRCPRGIVGRERVCPSSELSQSLQSCYHTQVRIDLAGFRKPEGVQYSWSRSYNAGRRSETGRNVCRCMECFTTTKRCLFRSTESHCRVKYLGDGHQETHSHKVALHYMTERTSCTMSGRSFSFVQSSEDLCKPAFIISGCNTQGLPGHRQTVA